MEDDITYEVVEDLAVVTMGAHRSRNALSRTLLDGLTQAVARSAAEEMRGLVLRSSCPVFCSGGDLGGLFNALDGDIDLRVGSLLDQFHSFIRLLRSHPMPVIAVVNGAAVGAGMALALSADVRIAGSEALFITGYLAVGASPDGGASMHLARALGGPQALSSFLLNRKFTVEELSALGLVDMVVGAGDLHRSAVEVGRRLARIPVEALQATRRLVDAAFSDTFDEHLDVEKENFIDLARTEKFRTGLLSFADRGK